jgi:chromosome segregation ATPase
MDVDFSMSQNSQNSRDPRLVNRPQLQQRTSQLSQHEAQQRIPSVPQAQQSVPENQNDTPADIFVRGISELVHAAAAAAANQSEKEKLQKKRDTTAELLRKARNHQGFPSTVEFFQNAKNEEDQVLAKIDQKIKENETNYKRLQADLKNNWAATTNSSRSPDTQEAISQLERANKTAKNTILDLRDDFKDLSGRIRSQDDQLRDFDRSLKALQDTARRNRAQDDQLRDLDRSVKGLQDTTRQQQRVLADYTSLDKDVQSLQEIVRNQQKSFADYTNSLSVLNNSLASVSSRLEQLEQLEQGAVPLRQGTAEPGQGTAAETKKALQNLEVQVMKLEKDAAVWGEKTGFLSSSYQRISALPDQVNRTLQLQQEKLDRLVDSQTVAKLNATVTKLDGQLGNLQENQSIKDDLVMAQFEELAGTLTRLKTDLEPNLERLTRDVEQLSAKVPTEPLEPKLATLGGDVQRLHQSLVRQHEGITNVGVGLQSLEMRYNNLSTDYIVQHMLGAFQEMYPQWDPTYKMLTRKVDQLEEHARNSTISTDELNHLKAECATLSQQWAGMLERYEWLSQEEFRQVQTRVDALAAKQSDIDGDLTSKKTADQALLQQVEHERELLNSRISVLSEDVKALKSECAQAKTSTDNDKTDMRSLELRIGGLEKSSQKIKEQLDALSKPAPPRELFLENGGSTREPPPKMQAPPRPNKPDLLDTAAAVKLKRRYPSTVSDDERSPAHNPFSPDTLVSPTVVHGDSRKKKKKKKIRNVEAEGPIEIDD